MSNEESKFRSVLVKTFDKIDKELQEIYGEEQDCEAWLSIYGKASSISDKNRSAVIISLYHQFSS